ncbi:MAG: type II toxin-antitoxin system RelE/ParE family toxin [Bacteroidota bacterium]
MAEKRFRIEVTPSAERDFYNEIAWLTDNQPKSLSKRFKSEFDRILRQLSEHPGGWQEVNVSGRMLRRAIIKSHWIVLYDVDELKSRVLILAVRGAAEDWMNTPVSD